MICWSYGGGVQSVAIGVLIKQAKLPRPDVAVIVDTEYEVETTWEYLDTIMHPYLLDLEIVRVPKSSYATVDLYRDDQLLIPAFTRQNGRVGRLSTFCSGEWKRRVVRRWLRERGVNDCDLWLGISTDELERMKPSGANWVRHIYPLIEMAPRNRRQCYEIIERAGLPLPHKSRCWMCPHQTADEWRSLRESDRQHAIQFDSALREHDPQVFVHFSGEPLSDVELSKPNNQLTLFDGCDSGFCWA